MLSVVFAGLLSAATVPLATFDGEANHTWSVENDPVMGGQSFSNFTVITDEAAGKTVGEWIGQCRIVPSLGAPGFTIALTESPALSTFPSAADEDVTAAPPNPGERGVHCWLAALLSCYAIDKL